MANASAPDAAEALRAAAHAPAGPVLLLDVGDNIGGGSPGDSVVILSAPPVEATATMLALHDGAFVATEPVHGGRRHFDAGRSVAVLLDTGQTVIITSKRVPLYSSAQLTTLGLATGQFKAIVAKGVHSPLPGFGPHVTHVMAVDTPGVASADLRHFSYWHRRCPLYPFEAAASFPEG